MSTGDTWLQVDGSDVAEVRSLVPVVLEHLGDGLVDLGEPAGLRTEDVFHGEVEAAIAGETAT